MSHLTQQHSHSQWLPHRLRPTHCMSSSPGAGGSGLPLSCPHHRAAPSSHGWLFPNPLPWAAGCLPSTTSSLWHCGLPWDMWADQCSCGPSCGSCSATTTASAPQMGPTGGGGTEEELACWHEGLPPAGLLPEAGTEGQGADFLSCCPSMPRKKPCQVATHHCHGLSSASKDEALSVQGPCPAASALGPHCQ